MSTIWLWLSSEFNLIFGVENFYYIPNNLYFTTYFGNREEKVSKRLIKYF